MSFQTTTAQSKIARLRKRIRIVQGGTSSSKTFSIIPLLISYAIENPMSEISIVSESIPHLNRGAIKDFQKIMILCDLYKDSQFNKSDLKYRFKNGSYIEFFSVDQPDKLRGARRDILFVNECNNIDFESYQQLSVRTKKFIYLDYNPTNEFWVHTELMNDKDTDFVVLTYKDNEALDKAIVKEIEKAKEKAKTSSYWDNWWKVYGLGQLGSLEGVIFNNWQIIDNIPAEATLLGFGLDFGFSNDPSSLIAVFQYNDKIICDERIYATGLLNSDIIRLMNHDKRLPIWADSAEPKSIEEIRRAGFNIKSVEKGKDSIVYGISVLQDKDILVTKPSINLIKELRSYSWDTDKAGKKLNKPIDDFNHAIDALRYFAMMHFKNSNRRFKIT
ncbi:terminase large subunit [Flavobacterium sp.]|uniref:PBSX family phage terminase large subunit n=1 Tax=Flavobacterium sp. TaxID=239 RepID=UPI003340BB10